MKAKNSDYKELNAELDNILASLQSDELDVDEAVALYEKGMNIIADLETHLKEAENKVAKIKADFS